MKEEQIEERLLKLSTEGHKMADSLLGLLKNCVPSTKKHLLGIVGEYLDVADTITENLKREDFQKDLHKKMNQNGR